MALQTVVVDADWVAFKYGFVGVKAAMPMFYGDKERAVTMPRKPCPDMTARAWVEFHAGAVALKDVEDHLTAQSYALHD